VLYLFLLPAAVLSIDRSSIKTRGEMCDDATTCKWMEKEKEKSGSVKLKPCEAQPQSLTVLGNEGRMFRGEIR